MLTAKRWICFLLCVTLALCCVTPVSAKEMGSDNTEEVPKNSDVEALGDQWYYYVDTNGDRFVYRTSFAGLPESVCCTGQIAEMEWVTDYPVEEILYYNGMLYLNLGNEIRIWNPETKEEAVLFGAPDKVSRFAALNGVLYYLCNGTIYQLDLQSNKQAVYLEKLQIQRFWFEDQYTISYMIDEQFIYHMDMQSGSTTMEQNNISDLGDPIVKADDNRGMTLTTLRNKFPQYKNGQQCYWNHMGMSSNNQDSVTTTPCNNGTNNSNTTYCNAFQIGSTQYSWQCMGYAEKCGYDVSGYNPRLNANGWTTISNKSAIDTLKAGDIVTYAGTTVYGHTIYVIAVNGDIITYTDCNGGTLNTTCGVRWDQTVTKSTIKAQFYESYPNKNYVRVSPSQAPEGNAPGKPSLNNFARSYAHGATTTFTWDSTVNTTHYNLYIDKQLPDGSWEVDYKVWHYATSGMTYQFNGGIYRVLLQATNSDASGWPYTNADYITFVVGSHTHDRGAYVFYEADHPHCNCYECSFCGEIWRDTTSSNELENCYYCQRPGKPVLSNFATSYVSGTAIVFRWNSVPKATHYNLYIDKKNSDGSWQVDFKYWHYATSGLTTTLDTGTYRVLLQAYNSNFPGEDGTGWAYTNGDYFTFIVTPANVTVTFDPNGGSVSPTTKTVTIGSTYGTLPTPTRTYYNFDGWYTAASGGSKVTASTTVTATSNHTLYAHWTHVCANGHNYSYAVSTSPTTTATGTLTGTCSRCGVTTTITLPKLTTTDYYYSIIQEATCTTNGTGRYTWKTTNYGTFSFDVAIPKTGHSYSDMVTPPTCTEQGYTTHTCSRCGDSYQDSYVDALGHNFGSWTQSKAPTCTEKGEEKRTCSRCNFTESREIVAIGHNWNNPVYAWAKDNSTVTASRTCKTDFSHIEVETVNTTWKVTKEATYDEEGEITYTAVFQKTAFATQTKVVKTPKLEKPDNSRPNPFVDVVEGQYYYIPVLWAYYHDPQVTAGTSKTKFSPSNTCTREQVVTFLWRAKGCEEPTSTENPFKDVPADAYYTKAVLWAVEKGVTNGTSKTKFGVGQPCTREQVVTFLWRAEGQPEPTSTKNPFTDVSETAYSYHAILWAVENGITNGTSKTKFSPAKTCTRGQIVTFLYRYMV